MQDLLLKEETKAFEVHGVLVPFAELSLFNYANVNTVFHSMAPLKCAVLCVNLENQLNMLTWLLLENQLNMLFDQERRNLRK